MPVVIWVGRCRGCGHDVAGRAETQAEPHRDRLALDLGRMLLGGLDVRREADAMTVNVVIESCDCPREGNSA